MQYAYGSETYTREGKEGQLFTNIDGVEWRVAVSPPERVRYEFRRTILVWEPLWSEFRQLVETGKLNEQFPRLQIYTKPEELVIAVVIPWVMRDDEWAPCWTCIWASSLRPTIGVLLITTVVRQDAEVLFISHYSHTFLSDIKQFKQEKDLK